MNTTTYKKILSRKYLQEALLVKIPTKCKLCIYYPPENRLCFYGYVPPCEFKKNRDVCKRWFKHIQTEINS